jgi:acylphosphatase
MYLRPQGEELGLRGWIGSPEDGRVEAVFEGEPEAVRHMIEWCSENLSFPDVR